MRQRERGRRAALAWAGGAAIVAGTAAVTALLVAILFRDGESTIEAPPTPTVSGAVTLRASPSEQADEIAQLKDGVPVTLAGRTEDSNWLLLSIPAQGVVGWAPAGVVQNAGDVSALPLVDGAREAQPLPASTVAPSTPVAGAPTQTPDYPDLVIEAVFSRENRLVVLIANEGNADIEGAIYVVVNGGEPVRVDVGGKPLRPGDTLETVLDEEYVQRRATAVVEVRTEDGVPEEDTGNNRFQTVVTPDVANDLEILSVELDTETTLFTITLRNNSIIPLVGVVTIAARRTAPSSSLIGRFTASLDVPAGGTQTYEQRFELPPDSAAFDLTSVQVILSTEAINDASASNNVFPR